MTNARKALNWMNINNKFAINQQWKLNDMSCASMMKGPDERKHLNFFFIQFPTLIKEKESSKYWFVHAYKYSSIASNTDGCSGNLFSKLNC